MSQKTHTIIFVPHARARFRQFHLSTRALVGLATAIIASLVVGVVFAGLWLRTARQNREVSEILSENRDLRAKSARLNGQLEAIERQLAEFEERTRRLALVAGLTSVNDAGVGGVGGLSTVSSDAAVLANAGLEEAAQRSFHLSSRLGRIEKRLGSRADFFAFTPAISPAVGLLTGGSGLRQDPFTGQAAFHSGIDISTARGNRVLAPATGVVVRSGWDNGFGRVVEIAHSYGMTTLFGHLDATKVREGQRVKRGDLIGLVGSTGRSTGPHLHYEVHHGGKPLNPLDYILDAF